VFDKRCTTSSQTDFKSLSAPPTKQTFITVQYFNPQAKDQSINSQGLSPHSLSDSPASVRVFRNTACVAIKQLQMNPTR